MRSLAIISMLAFLPLAAGGQIAARSGTEVKEIACGSVTSRQIAGAVRGSTVAPPSLVTISSVSPTFGPPGTTVVINGSGFSSLTGVMPDLPWTVKCDTQLLLTLKVVGADPPYASVQTLTNPFLQNAAGNVQLPTLQVLLPPKQVQLGPTKSVNGQPIVVLEEGTEVFVTGYGLSDPPNISPTVTIGSVKLPIVSASATQVRAMIPAGTPTAPLTFATAGGSVTVPGSVTVLSGQTVLESISAPTAPVGSTVTVTGLNLFRLYGFCNGSTPHVPVVNDASSKTPWTNNSASFVVPSNWNGTVPVWMWVNLGGEIKCLASPLTLEIK